MDLAAVFALSLLGGYYFGLRWRLTAYATRRVEGQHLYFRAALFGVVLFLISLALRQGLLAVVPSYPALDQALVNYVEPALKLEGGESVAVQTRRAEWVVTALYSLGLGGLVLPWILNRFTPKIWAARRSVGPLDSLLLRAQQTDMPVAVTLDTGKVYIGAVASITDPDVEPRAIVMAPMFSGHRDAKGRMRLTTDYESVYAALNGQSDDLDDEFNLIIRADTVVTAHPFSPAIYAAFHPNWQEDIRAYNRPDPPLQASIELRRAPTPARPSAAATP